MKTPTIEDINNSKQEKDFGSGSLSYYSITEFAKSIDLNLDNLPFSIRVLLENVLRNFDGELIGEEDVKTYVEWPIGVNEKDIPYMPARVVLQDFTGIPLLVDLADMREAMQENGGDPAKINPLIPTDLVIDHSVQIDFYGSPEAFAKNIDMEYKRNLERYKLIKWAQKSFKNMRVVPPGSGIVHQVNLEFLSPLVDVRDNTLVLDSVVGTDSHTPMINGLGVLGWGVGGIEAEANMLGQPYYLLLPEVIGFKLTGSLPEGATATDLVLTITEILRKKGVVGKFIEYFGPGLDNLTVTDRATISNMSPEHGCTLSYFPVDEKTIEYLLLTGRDPEHVKVIEAYLKHQKLFRTSETPDPTYTEILELNMGSIVPSLSGPRNPEERVSVPDLPERLSQSMQEHFEKRGSQKKEVQITLGGQKRALKDGDVVIAAITSCTNTSNPSVLVGAGLLAKKAVELGLQVNPKVKTSLAPGSTVVREYLSKLGLSQYLNKLGFNEVAIGCTTCIGNSGPLLDPIEDAIKSNDLYVSAVASGNRNFPGRLHPLVRGNFLASPMLVVSYALAGTTNINLQDDPLGIDKNGNPVYLKDIWPQSSEIQTAIKNGVTSDLFKKQYSTIMNGDAIWRDLDVSESLIFNWDKDSTYIRRPPYFSDYSKDQKPISDINDARVLVLASEKVSTDHISPAGSIAKDSPAGKYLIEHGVEPAHFNSYGSRRGNHEVMMRGTFGNVRLRNLLAEGKEGWWTKNLLTGKIEPIFDAAMDYIDKNIPLIILGAKQYGQGSSRDWAAKGPLLQGVKAVIVEQFERIHRSNLIGMGVLPMTFEEGKSWANLGLDGTETFTITGLSDLQLRKKIKVTASKDGKTTEFYAILRLEAPIEIEYVKNGGILQFIVTQFLK